MFRVFHSFIGRILPTRDHPASIILFLTSKGNNASVFLVRKYEQFLINFRNLFTRKRRFLFVAIQRLPSPRGLSPFWCCEAELTRDFNEVRHSIGRRLERNKAVESIYVAAYAKSEERFKDSRSFALLHDVASCYMMLHGDYKVKRRMVRMGWVSKSLRSGPEWGLGGCFF